MKVESISSSLNSGISEILFPVDLCRFGISTYFTAQIAFLLFSSATCCHRNCMSSVSLNFCHSLKFGWNLLMESEVARRSRSQWDTQHSRKVMQRVNFVFYGDIICVILWCMHVLFTFLAWEIPVMLSLLNFTYELTSSYWNKEQ